MIHSPYKVVDYMEKKPVISYIAVIVTLTLIVAILQIFGVHA